MFISPLFKNSGLFLFWGGYEMQQTYQTFTTTVTLVTTILVGVVGIVRAIRKSEAAL
jgi:hypothetical protein